MPVHSSTDTTPPRRLRIPRLPFLLSACGGGPADAKLKLVVHHPPHIPDAKLTLDTILPNEKTMEVEYRFKVNGFELKAQTPDAGTRGCANSADGQHIHFILNNKPYLAEYNSDFKAKADPGRNIALSFLSRSYHESVKNSDAVVLKEFNMPGEGGMTAGDMSKDLTLFYSRPKGDYKKLDGDKILLDFYLLNGPEGWL